MQVPNQLKIRAQKPQITLHFIKCAIKWLIDFSLHYFKLQFELQKFTFFKKSEI